MNIRYPIYEGVYRILTLEGDGFSIEARCQDQNTLIKINIWVNGKLKKNISGNKYVTSGYISLL